MIINEVAATLAWEETVKIVNRIGGFDSVQFDDHIIHSVIEVMGGWTQLCYDLYNINEEEKKYKQREFRRLYFVLSSKKKHPGFLRCVKAVQLDRHL